MTPPMRAVLAALQASLSFRPDDEREGRVGALLAADMASSDLAGRAEALSLPPDPLTFAAQPVVASWVKEAASVYTASAAEALSRRITRQLQSEVEQIMRDAARSGARALTVRERVLRAFGSDEPDEIKSRVLARADTLWNTALAHARAAGAMRAGTLASQRGSAALHFHACDDDRVRPNHFAADGFLARVDDPVWAKLAPPLGYQCRCRLTVEQASVGRFKSSPPGAHADPDFPRLGRPDEWFYGA